MGSRRANNLLIIIVIIVCLIIVFSLVAIKGKKTGQAGQEQPPKKESSLEKKELSQAKLEEIWKKALGLAGGKQQTGGFPKEMGNREAKVKVDAFFPPIARTGEGLKTTTDTLEELVNKYKDKLLVRIYLIVGPIADETGLDCAAVFINGKNYIRADGEEIVLLKKNTHDPQLLRKAIEQAIKENYGEPVP